VSTDNGRIEHRPFAAVDQALHDLTAWRLGIGVAMRPGEQAQTTVGTAETVRLLQPLKWHAACFAQNMSILADPPPGGTADQVTASATVLPTSPAGPAKSAAEVTASDVTAVELSAAAVTFGRGPQSVVALAETSLRVADGSFVALVGPSGCGKSTILKLASGLIAPTQGVVVVGGREVASKALRIGMAFQNPTMLPWLSIEKNIMLPLKIVEPFRSSYRAKRKGEYRDRAHALLAQVGLSGFASHFPWQLSGGMLQRANLCRALIHEPRLLLLDEPFGALDQFTREELWAILQELWQARRPTVLLVTHDLREAGFLASRICVMSARPGRIIADSAVEFARPRTIAMTFEPDFVALNQRLRELIVEARAPMPGQGH
jgi:NitT/TauT family transport system ATP-binding protein